jgi:putative oxidoreductase
MKRIIFLDFISGLFALLFLYTGISKIIDHKNFIFDLGRDPMIGVSLATFASYALPTIEVLITAALLIPKTQKIGIISSVVLMCCFTVYVRWMLHSPIRHCTCGGVLRQMTWQQHLYFNIGFTILSFVGLYLAYSKRGRNRSLSLQT